jgi:uncharacterized protein (TIGR00106 family)
MSVLLEMSMFPTDKTESKSAYVSEVIKVIQQSGFNYQLTPMATIIETPTMQEALNVAQACYEVLDKLECNRVYATLKFDIRKNYKNRMQQKVESIRSKIGEVNT